MLFYRNFMGREKRAQRPQPRSRRDRGPNNQRDATQTGEQNKKVIFNTWHGGMREAIKSADHRLR